MTVRRALLCIPASLLVGLAAVSPIVGCSAKKRAVSAAAHEVVAQRDGEGGDSDDAPWRANETTEMSTDQMGSFCSGALGCTIEGIGWVLALPFRALVGLVDVLF